MAGLGGSPFCPARLLEWILRAGKITLAFIGLNLVWTGYWILLDDDIWPHSIKRDIIFVVVGVLFMALSNSLVGNSGVRPAVVRLPASGHQVHDTASPSFSSLSQDLDAPLAPQCSSTSPAPPAAGSASFRYFIRSVVATLASVTFFAGGCNLYDQIDMSFTTEIVELAVSFALLYLTDSLDLNTGFDAQPVEYRLWKDVWRFLRWCVYLVVSTCAAVLTLKAAWNLTDLLFLPRGMIRDAVYMVGGVFFLGLTGALPGAAGVSVEDLTNKTASTATAETTTTKDKEAMRREWSALAKSCSTEHTSLLSDHSAILGCPVPRSYGATLALPMPNTPRPECAVAASVVSITPPDNDYLSRCLAVPVSPTSPPSSPESSRTHSGSVGAVSPPLSPPPSSRDDAAFGQPPSPLPQCYLARSVQYSSGSPYSPFISSLSSLSALCPYPAPTISSILTSVPPTPSTHTDPSICAPAPDQQMPASNCNGRCSRVVQHVWHMLLCVVALLATRFFWTGFWNFLVVYFVPKSAWLCIAYHSGLALVGFALMWATDSLATNAGTDLPSTFVSTSPVRGAIANEPEPP